MLHRRYLWKPRLREWGAVMHLPMGGYPKRVMQTQSGLFNTLETVQPNSSLVRKCGRERVDFSWLICAATRSISVKMTQLIVSGCKINVLRKSYMTVDSCSKRNGLDLDTKREGLRGNAGVASDSRTLVNQSPIRQWSLFGEFTDSIQLFEPRTTISAEGGPSLLSF